MNELPLSGEPLHVYYMNGERVESRRWHVSATSARARLSPQTAGYSILCEHDDGYGDRYVNDSFSIPMGARLYSVPPAVFGG